MTKHYSSDDNPDLSRFPKWVAQFVDALKRRIGDLERLVSDLSSVHPSSNVVMAGLHKDPDIGLPPDSRIYFYAGEPRDRLSNMIEVHHDREHPNRLYIASYGSRGVRIIPSSSNSFYLEMEQR